MKALVVLAVGWFLPGDIRPAFFVLAATVLIAAAALVYRKEGT